MEFDVGDGHRCRIAGLMHGLPTLLMIDIEGGVVDSVTETRGQFVHSKKPDSLLPVSVMAACIEDI